MYRHRKIHINQKYSFLGPGSYLSDVGRPKNRWLSMHLIADRPQNQSHLLERKRPRQVSAPWNLHCCLIWAHGIQHSTAGATGPGAIGRP